MSKAINKDVNSLDDKFKIKFISWWSEVIAKYPNARVFEARRSIERQKYLYAQWRYKPYENNKVVTWTMQSKHLEGKAVDIVFLDDKGNPTRNGPYDDLIEMAKKYGIHNLKPRETCHFQCDWTEYIQEAKKEIDPLVKKLIDNNIWNGIEWDWVTMRVALLVAKAIFSWK